MFLANSLSEFKQQFIQQLHNMLDSDSLGAFILVLANSMQDQALRDALNETLQQRFNTLNQADNDNAPIDDQYVFKQIKQHGIASLSNWKYWQKSPWELVYNPLRAMRPARSSQAKIDSIRQDFNPQGFHFNKPFLKPEIYWEGDWQGDHYRVLYNKFPFAPWHLIIVPQPEAEQPQYLTQQAHQQIFKISRQTEHLPGFGIGFNSLGANASINQLHFQSYIREDKLPIESPLWRHNGGNKDYPLSCQRHSEANAAWQAISQLHQNNQPYHLLYREGHCYILPRKKQGTVTLPTWAQGAGWHELFGVFTLFDIATIKELHDSDIYDTVSAFQP